MPTNSNPYQATTVSFENPSGFIPHQTSTTSRLKATFRKPWMKIILLVGALFFLTLGLCVMCTSYVDYEDAVANEDNVTEMPVHEKGFDEVLMILGVFFTLFGAFLLGLYIRVIDCWRRSCAVCPCSYRKKQLVRQLQGNSGGQIMALNPSTDPLVCSSAQYAPISEIPRYEDEEEGKKLMHDGSNAAEESHLLTDPRIVLKPASTQD